MGILGLGLVMMLAQAPESPQSVASLAFMAGSWRGELPGGGFIEEHWSPMPNGPMMGMFRRVEKDRMRFSEALIIAQEGTEVRFRLRHYRGDTLESFEGNTPMVFRLVSVKDRVARFEGEGTDKGTQLVYRRTEQGLDVLLERPGTKAGKVELSFKPWTLTSQP